MARHHEGSAKDEAEDRRGAKKAGMSRKAYEGSAQDRAEDAAGERGVKVKGHSRSPPPRRPPPPPPVMPAGNPQQQMPAGPASPVGLATPPGGDMEGLD